MVLCVVCVPAFAAAQAAGGGRTFMEQPAQGVRHILGRDSMTEPDTNKHWEREREREGETHSKAEATAPTSFTQGTHFVLELHRVSRIQNYISFKTLHFWKDFLVARNSGSLWYDLRLEHEAVEWITRRRFTLSELTWTIATLSVHVHRICCDHTAQV